MPTTAFVTLDAGRVTAGSTVTVGGVTRPVPGRCSRDTVLATRRIAETLQAMGWTPNGWQMWRNVAGGVEIDVEPYAADG